MKAVISVVGDYIDKSTKEDDHNPNYSYATWQEITQAATTGHIEFGNHTYSMHSLSPRNGAGKKRGEDSSAYQNALEQDLSKLQDALEANCNLRPIVFAYPFGNISDDSFEVIKKLGFRASLSCRERVSKVDPFDTGSLYLLGRYNRPAGIETADFFKRMLE